MKIRMCLNLVGMILGLAGCASTVLAQDAQFFRVVSTQETRIVSIDSDGVLTWENTVSNAPCSIESRRLNGLWTNTLPFNLLQTEGLRTRCRVPLFFVAGRILVGFRDTVTEDQANRLVQSNRLVWESHFPKLFSYWVKVLSGAPADHIATLQASNIVMWAQQRAKPEGDPSATYLLVQFNTRATQELAAQFIGSIPGLQVDSITQSPRWGIVFVRSGTEGQWINRFLAYPEVKYAELDGIMTIY